MRYALLCLSLVLFSFSLNAQEKEGMSIDREAWKKSIEHLEYQPEKDRVVKERTNYEMPEMGWLKYVAYVAVAAIIVVLLILLLQNARPVQTISKERIEAETLEEAEENLPDLMLNKIFDEALAKSEFKKALRIKFLMVLQSLIDTGMIVWKKRKTNEQYIREISDAAILKPFSTLALAFDDVWYGESELSPERFHGLVSGLDTLNTQINGSQEG